MFVGQERRKAELGRNHALLETLGDQTKAVQMTEGKGLKCPTPTCPPICATLLPVLS